MCFTAWTGNISGKIGRFIRVFKLALFDLAVKEKEFPEHLHRCLIEELHSQCDPSPELAKVASSKSYGKVLKKFRSHTYLLIQQRILHTLSCVVTGKPEEIAI